MPTSVENLYAQLKELNKADFEHFEHMSEEVNSGKMTHEQFFEHVAQVSPNLAQHLRNAHKGKRGGHPHSNFVPEHKIDFTLNVSRKITVGNTFLTNGAGQGINLPGVIFLLSDYDAEYANTVPNLLVQGGNDGTVFLKNVIKGSNAGNDVTLVYANRADTLEEQVTISMLGGSYVGLINGMRTTSLGFIRPKIRIDNSLSYNQFNQPVYKLDKSIFTSTSNDYFYPSSYEPEITPNPTMRVIENNFDFDPETGWGMMMIPYANGAVANGVTSTVTINCFIEHWNKHAEHKGAKK